MSHQANTNETRFSSTWWWNDACGALHVEDGPVVTMCGWDESWMSGEGR